MKGVVAAGHEVTAKAASSILQEGGNAFDAVLAAVLASCVPEFVLSSLGGGGFMMAHVSPLETALNASQAIKPGETRLYDFFAQTPKHKKPQSDIDFHAIHANFGPAVQEFHIGAGSTATPGVIPGLFAIHNDLCSLPLDVIIAPAVEAAREGVVMSAFQAYLYGVIEPILTHYPMARALFAPNGHTLRQGERFVNPGYADTLESLVREGLPLYQQGALGQAILTQSRDHGGHLTPDDLLSYKVERRAPLIKHYRDHKLYLNPAPSAGGPLIGFSLGALERLCPSGVPELTDFVDVMSLTNQARDRRLCALPDFAGDPHIEQQLTAAANHPTSSRGTTHISVIDATGNAAALTISNGEGNGLMLGNTGIMLNNMLGEEDLHDDGFDSWQPDTRLSSMMAPTFMEGPGEELTVLGSGGSNRIRSAILQVTSALVDRQLSLRDAIDAPRLHVEKCGTISFEAQPTQQPFTTDAKQTLLAAHPDAHAWPEPNMFFGGVHGVLKQGLSPPASNGRPDDSLFQGEGDLRRDGISISVTS